MKNNKGVALADWRGREIKDLEGQLKNQPRDVRALTHLGRLYSEDIWDHPAAFACLWKAADISRARRPDDTACPNVTMALADLQLRRGEFAQARFKYMDVLKLEPENRAAMKGKVAAQDAMDDALSASKSEGVLRTLFPSDYSPRTSSGRADGEGYRVVHFEPA